MPGSIQFPSLASQKVTELMDRITTLLQKIQILQCPTDMSKHHEADLWVQQWRVSEWALGDSLLLLEKSNDNRVLFVAVTTLMNIIRSFSFTSLTPDVITNLVSCLFQFTIKHQHEPEKESVRFALICIVDISLRTRSENLTIVDIWNQLPTQALRTQALLLFMEDASEPFCKTNDMNGMYVTARDFAFGLEQLQTLECSETWLRIWQAMVNVATSNEVFIPLIPRWKDCLGDVKMIHLIISIIAQFLVTETGRGTMHLVVLEFGLSLSIYLRSKYSESGDREILSLIGWLWTNMLDIEDPNATFLENVELMGKVYDEFFVCADLLVMNFENIPYWENADWMGLVKSTIDMCQCFGEQAENVGHPLEYFVPRSLNFIGQALDKGFMFEEQHVSLGLLYQSAPELIKNYLTERLQSRSPSLLIIVALLQKYIPVELVHLYSDHLDEFSSCPTYHLVFFVTMEVDIVPERLPQYVDVMINLFSRDPDLVSHYLQKMVVHHGARIVQERPQIVSLLSTSLDHLSHDAAKNVIITLADLSVFLNSQAMNSALEVIGKGILKFCSSPQTIKTGLSLLTQVIAKVTEVKMTEPVVQHFAASMCNMIVGSNRQLWESSDYEIQSQLAMMMAVCLKIGVLSKDVLQFVVSWINAMICRVEVGEYLLCLPFLTEFFPIPNVIEFLAKYSPNEHGNDPILRHVIACMEMMFRTFGVNAWNFIPPELLGRCFLNPDNSQALELFKLVRIYAELIPPDYIPTLLSIILHETVFKYQYLITDRAAACMVSIGKRCPEAFVKCFYDALPVPQSTELANLMLAQAKTTGNPDPDTLTEEVRKRFGEFRAQLSKRL